MLLQALGYLGVYAKSPESWRSFGALLGMQLADSSRDTLAFRIDDRSQRVTVHAHSDDGLAYSGWEVSGPSAFSALAVKLESAGVKVERGSRALAEQRRVSDLFVCHDPGGNRLEIFHGLLLADMPFVPGRNIGGFRTGSLGMGHIVLMCERIEELLPFYTDLLGFRLSDYMLSPFKAYFLHTNARHHSLAFVENGQNGQLHHMMLELLHLDDVGKLYDVVQGEEERLAVSLGRHSNDLTTSFYAATPSKFLIEYGWGGLSLDPAKWQPHEMTSGPSLWGHDRFWMPRELRAEVRATQIKAGASTKATPVHVDAGNYVMGLVASPWETETTSLAGFGSPIGTRPRD